MIYDTLDLKEMEIVSNQFKVGTPVKIQTIDTLTKKELNHLSLAELLTANSPVFIKSYGKGGVATAAFRGTAASHTKVLWNGFEINSPMLGQLDLSLVPNSFYDNAKLEYGGSSLESTSGALGGSIILESNKKRNREIIEFTQTIGSFKTYTSALKINLGEKRFKSNTSIYLSSSENSFEYYNNAVIPAEWQNQENASYYNRGFTQGFSYEISERQSLEIISWNQWNFREIPPIMSNQQGGNNQEEQKSFNSRNIINWKYQHSKTVVEVNAAWFMEDMSYRLKTTTAIDPEDTVSYINSKNLSNSGFLTLKLNQNLNKGWLLSSELKYTRTTVTSNNYTDTKQRNTYGIYVKLSKDFSNRINTQFMLRQEIIDNKFITPMPYLGMSWKPIKNEDLFFRLSGNLNYNLPSLNDLYWYPGGNEDLLAEEGIQFETGLSYSKSYNKPLSISADLSFYSSHISNWIQWVPSDYRYWTAMNIAFVHARGMESSFSLNGSIKEFNYKISALYSYNKSTNESRNAKDEGYSGKQLIYVPLHSGNIFAYLMFKNFQLNWNTQFTGKRNTSLNEDQYSNVLPAYSINNFSVGRNFITKYSDINLSLKINNIFDNNYQAILWRPMPGRNFELVVSFNIK